MKKQRIPTGTLIDTVGIAKLIGRSRQRAYQLALDANFPGPLDVLSTGPVWNRQEVVEYLERRPADRRTLEARIHEGRSKRKSS
jgi:predicted DNA-binding transcriptional regulator AlpA